MFDLEATCFFIHVFASLTSATLGTVALQDAMFLASTIGIAIRAFFSTIDISMLAAIIVSLLLLWCEVFKTLPESD